MPNAYGPLGQDGGLAVARLGELVGADRLGLSVYELQNGEAMDFHYHLQREELLVVLRGTLSLRTATGWRDVPEGEVVAFPRGERGAHGYENRTPQPVRLLMISEQNAPNVSVYPDRDEIGIFDAAARRDRRFGARFAVTDALSAYGGGEAAIVPPAPHDLPGGSPSG
jgi:uncharacterized cupin superfamily protein